MPAEIDTLRAICALDDLESPGARSFTVGSGDWPLRGLVVRRGADVRAYVNRCPHAGHPLNLRPNEFLTSDESLILCRSHGALFEMTTGYCVAGPCVGQTLQPVGVQVVDGYVMLEEDPDRLASRFA
jgi:nitrite reductase/ring-hydroxylating ferredoxin subunit